MVYVRLEAPSVNDRMYMLDLIGFQALFLCLFVLIGGVKGRDNGKKKE
jgi:hypothetical protein